MIRMENRSRMGMESNKRTGMKSNRRMGMESRVRMEMESKDGMERRGLSEIKVKGWNRSSCNNTVTEINRMYFNIGVKMQLQLMCCTLTVRTKCL